VADAGGGRSVEHLACGGEVESTSPNRLAFGVGIKGEVHDRVGTCEGRFERLESLRPTQVESVCLDAGIAPRRHRTIDGDDPSQSTILPEPAHETSPDAASGPGDDDDSTGHGRTVPS